MQQQKIRGLTDFMRKKALHGGGAFLAAIALFFASVTCLGHLYEPEIPENFK